MEQYISLLPNIFTQCSITGGEPLLSVFFEPILNLIKKKYPKVVLTTNGSNLLDKEDILKGVVNHVNISRHCVDDEKNYAIFGDKEIPSTLELTSICEKLNSMLIDVNLNCIILDPEEGSKDFVFDFISYAKKIGASSVTFRKDYKFNNLDLMKLDNLFPNTTFEKGCPVCKTRQKLIKGMNVFFKYSLKEPSDSLKFIYEAIYHPSGFLTEDWAGLKEIKFISSKNSVQKFVNNFSSCGQTKHFSSCSQNTGSCSHGC